MPHPLHIDQEHNNAIRAEVGERLRIIFRLAGRQKVPQPIRHFINRLDEHEIEMKTSPSIAPSEKEGWLRRLLASRLR